MKRSHRPLQSRFIAHPVGFAARPVKARPAWFDHRTTMEDIMLKYFAAALIAASVIAAPALAQTTAPSTAPKPTVTAPATPAKVAKPTKSVKHVRKHKRHAMKVHVKHRKVAKSAHAPKAYGKANGRIAPR